MGSIDIAFDQPQDLTVVFATGKLKADDFHRLIREYYSGPLTANILLDINEADLSAFHSNDIAVLAGHTKQVSEAHRDGKIAVVANKSLEYGLGRMFGAYMEAEGTPFEVESFRNHAEALDWFGMLPNPTVSSPHPSPSGHEECFMELQQTPQFFSTFARVNPIDKNP
jgi:hypothetical protein